MFDHVHPETGPGFAADHPRVADPAERQAIADYLDSGTPVLLSPTLLDDVLDPARTAVVPVNFLTDGRWVWTDTVTYYLQRHGLAPEPELLAHLRSQGPAAAPVPAETVRRAAGFVLTPRAN
ncbi:MULTISPECIES: hypothetical protein [unclassified Crossiella]|uniref:hypothetical protein n=1 Tax=unclassified Crossiella TaxID=2620835 RepID=UPI001FFEAD20|nr:MULTISPECIES: hypothetical protein [unclassified Crossiella]MCK2239939.1 hypothetical protein [Crossiella sp. S99.2]MCK2252647.1 hypothetical protein [Crossiella sp. S99.1]